MSAGRVVVAVVLLGLLGVAVWAVRPRSDDAPAPPSARVVAREQPAALRVLHAWDRRRAGAYAAGSASRLAGLYVERSSAGARDVRVLRGYRSRGLRVPRLRMQLLAVSVLDRGVDRWRLRVTDRLADGVAVAGHRRLPLPHDHASTRVVTLVRGEDDRWRVARVASS